VAPPSRAAEHGFTLLETLVVLAIAAMVSGILFQAYDVTLRLDRQFGVEYVASQQGVMLSDWFRQGLQGLQPDYPEGSRRFKGDAKKLSGLSTSALTSEFGVPATLAWELRYDSASGETSLVAGAESAPLLTWPGTTGRFVYLDAKGEAHETWPPPLGQWPQLPSSIRLEARRNGAPYVIVATPMGPTSARARPIDITGVRP
jgi:prepilin-type N-terminal cleavage/methylation domain-containing protein